jgi:hypothetical protein
LQYSSRNEELWLDNEENGRIAKLKGYTEQGAFRDISAVWSECWSWVMVKSRRAERKAANKRDFKVM